MTITGIGLGMRMGDKLIITLLVAVALPAWGDVSIQENATLGREIKIYGQISQSDIGKVKNALEASNKQPKIVLSSLGGDAEAALRIGDLIYNKTYEAGATVDGVHHEFKIPARLEVSGGYYGRSRMGDECASACVLIFASSKLRFMLNDYALVIHSPYLLDTGLSYEEVKKNRQRLKDLGFSNVLCGNCGHAGTGFWKGLAGRFDSFPVC